MPQGASSLSQSTSRKSPQRSLRCHSLPNKDGDAPSADALADRTHDASRWIFVPHARRSKFGELNSEFQGATYMRKAVARTALSGVICVGLWQRGDTTLLCADSSWGKARHRSKGRLCLFLDVEMFASQRSLCISFPAMTAKSHVPTPTTGTHYCLRTSSMFEPISCLFIALNGILTLIIL